MSKIEEALEKANRMRGDGNSKPQMPRPADDVDRLDNASCYAITIKDPESPIAEEYRRLKSMVIRETKADFLNTIMVTSALEGEGKSLTSVNLAVTIAQEIDHSILLVDADLRRPMIHNYLGIENVKGLSDYLISGGDVSEVINKSGVGNLSVITAGKPVDNPVELLSSDRMKALIKELKQRYMDRYVIIDTPPILSFAEAIAIVSFVDGVIIVAREGRTQLSALENAFNQVKDAKILGVVFNDASYTNLQGSYDRYGYYKYKRKEQG
ncbi:MAG: polysaccharide biosynthesis tyrosine autokinase [Nitrospira sp.]|nr:polysaccharide biosynthesis tyrosine autokinase [Candidatus Brocadiales bacterium]MBL7048834.1 polysaccharide biosynthesis tyrosine autokinase [Nitrospira sp.]